MIVSSTEPTAIKVLGSSSQLPERFGADVLIPVRGTWLGVQRKAIPDLIASVHDGRLAKELAQMQRLAIAVLIVEGRPRWTADGVLMSSYGAKWTKTSHRNLLHSVQDRGIWVDQTESMSDTVAAVLDLEHWALKNKHASLMRRPGPTSIWGRADHHDFQSHVAQSFPGVGPEMADNIIEHFGGLPLRWTVSEADMTKVKGIGPKKARAMWQALEHEEVDSDSLHS